MFKKILFFFFFIHSVYSQNTLSHYNRGIECFLNQDYICAKDVFFQFLMSDTYKKSELTEYVSYYHFLSSLRLYHPETELLFNEFSSLFPTSNKRKYAVFFISEYFFEKKEYEKVVDLLSEINLYQLDNHNKNLAFFYLGYSSYVIGNDELAKSSFYELKSVFDHPFQEDAIFFNSQVLLRNDDLINALSGFEILKTGIKYRKDVPYFISKILFQLNKYRDLTDYLKSLNDSTLYKYSDLVLFQAKSFFHLSEYTPAVVYFEEYKSLVDTLNQEQLYEIGFSYYKKELYGMAINHLNKIIETEDSISQYAFYYLADSYRQINNNLEAMNAFRSASLLTSDSLIQHDAAYQFALLSYNQNNPLYDSVEHLSEFLEKYPSSEHTDEIYRCLANIYLNSNNYDKAINVLEDSDLSDDNIREQYQKICFFKGVQLYNDLLYKDAIFYFDKAIQIHNNSELLFQTYYWKAEALYNLKSYGKALDFYQKLPVQSKLYLKSLYSQGYCFLKQKKYDNSINSFLKSVQYNSDPQILHDIYIRIADGYFSLHQYELSADFFHKALMLGGVQSDYASYKKSTSYFLLKDYNRAIEALSFLIETFPQSNYMDDAVFDLGNVYIMNKQFELAIKSFKKITSDFPKSLFFSLSKLKLGLVYYLQQLDEEAVVILKDLLIEFPNTNVSEQSLNIIKNIYNETGKADQFLNLLEDIDHDYTKSELDSSTYFSAELQYMQSNYNIAISALKSYLSYYPNGLFFLEANYFLYKSYEKIGDLEQAIDYLNKIVNTQQNKYTIEGLLALAKISFELKKYISSETYFQQLVSVASSFNVKQQAILGLVESKYHLYKYNDVIQQISDLTVEDFFSGKDLLRIRYLNASSLYKTNRNKEAKLEFEWLIKNSDGVLKAESFFYTALILYNDKEYHRSQEFIFELIDDLPSYEAWIDKALLLLAKNYIQQGDFFQAKHVLNELKNKTDDTDILNQIKSILLDRFSISSSDSIIEKNDN